MGRQLGIEDEFFGQAAGALFPEGDEAEDLVVLLVLAQFPGGVAEDTCVSILGQESEDALLAGV